MKPRDTGRTAAPHGTRESMLPRREQLQRALDLAQRIALVEVEAFCFGELGIIADLHGDPQLARTYFERRLSLAQSTGNRRAGARRSIRLVLSPGVSLTTALPSTCTCDRSISLVKSATARLN